MGLPVLDLYLARAFIPYRSIWETLAARGADPMRVEETWMRLVKEVPHNIAAFTNTFGAPSEEREGSYYWPLTLWPDHLWAVGFMDAPINLPLNRCEIVRRVPGQPDRVSPLSLDGARRVLRLGYDGVAEVQAALGDAPRADGWWPWDSTEYDCPDGSTFQCIFMHGILVDLSRERL